MVAAGDGKAQARAPGTVNAAVAWLLYALAALLGLYALIVAVLVVAARRETVRAVAGFVPDCLVLFSRLLRDRRLPRRKRLLVAALVPYLALPFDLVPDFVPVAGQLDDAVIVAFVLRRVARGNPELLRELWPGPDSSLKLLLRLVEGKAGC
jgi:uncharacterized membrane protein YkvA (DUF1232 family)